MKFKSFLVAAILAAGFSAGVNAAEVMIVDRGLPDTNLNNVAGANRSNVAWDFGGFGYMVGDSFTVGSNATITKLRTWVIAGAANNNSNTADEVFSLSDRFASLSLFAGTNVASLSEVSTGAFVGGNVTNNPNISISRVQYPGGGSELDYQGTSSLYINVFQIDFNLNMSVSAGQEVWFAVDGLGPNDSPGPTADFGDDTFTTWFNHASNAALSGTPQDFANDSMNCFFRDGGGAIDCGTYASLGDGWDKNSDINVQVFAQVPEPGTITLIGASLLGLGFIRRRQAA